MGHQVLVRCNMLAICLPFAYTVHGIMSEKHAFVKKDIAQILVFFFAKCGPLISYRSKPYIDLSVSL